MKPTITRAGKIGAQDDIIILGTAKSIFEPALFTRAEKQYIKQQIASDELTLVINKYPRLVFIQLIEQKEEHYKQLEASRVAATRIYPRLKENHLKKITILHSEGNIEETLAFAEGLALYSYQFLRYQTESRKKEYPLKEIALATPGIRIDRVNELNTILSAVYQARDLINEPASSLNAVQLAKE